MQSDNRSSASSTSPPPSPQVIYLGPDQALAQRIGPLLAKQGVELSVAAAPGEVPPGFGRRRIVLLDTAALGPEQTVNDYAAPILDPDEPATELAVLSRSRSLAKRLEALRADAAAYFVAPIASAEVVAKLVELSRPRARETGRVLIVEDSALQAIVAERALKGAGFAVRILTEPLKVLEVLDGFAPDLILMDLHMPAASGDELAVAIREHEGFQAIPIVYVSDETDPDRQAEALGRGGDAFIAKPVSPDVLVRMVSRRIQASRTQRQQSAATEYRDPDTGLFTRRHFMNRLDRALSEPGCEDPGVGLLFVAIDNLSQVGDQVGAAGADLVQDRVGVMIRGQLGADDMASRLDRHCHALVLKRLDADSLRQAAEDLRQLIAGYPIAISGKTLSITASVGIAPLQAGAGDALGLIHCARRACADARRNGGNRIGVYGPKAQGLVEEIHEQRTAGLVERALADPDGAAGFRVLYQPLVAINVDQQQFLAVILCLASPDGEPTQDRDFWSAAEHGGLTPDVDRWLLLRALDALRAQSEAQPELRLFVPQHMASLIGEGWTVWLREQIQAFGLDKARPILELGFPDLLNHFNVASSLIKMLGKIGVDVCLTDVDQTAAAQDLVVDLQPRFVKVSPTALRQTKPEALMRVVDRLRRGGSQLIAAGVDMPDQIAPIWASGFNYAQGAVIQTPLHEPVFDWNEVEMR